MIITLFLKCLRMPDHSKFLHELPDESLANLLPVAKKVAIAAGAEQYNILQVIFNFPYEFPLFFSLGNSLKILSNFFNFGKNNGPLAHQVVEHVHVHVVGRNISYFP